MTPLVTRLGQLLLVVSLTTSLAGHAEQSNAKVRPGGSLTIGMEANFPVFDPMTMGALVERSVAAAFYETLFELDENGELQPLLATGYDVSEDGKTYTIELRQDVQFHDGTDFNAHAVASNFWRMLDPANGCRCLAEIGFVEDVKALDDYTVRFRLAMANAGFIGLLADVSGMQPSPTAIEKHGEAFAENPVGTGPFRFVSWRRGVALTVERNPHYWRKGLPYLDEIVYRPIPDTQTRMASLRAGDIDIATVPAPEDVAAVREGTYDFQLIEAPALGTVFTMFNTQRPPFNDKRVRRAIFHSLDRELINRALNHDIYPISNNPYGEGQFGGELVNDYPEFDPQKAKALLADYGQPVRFQLTVVAVPNSLRLAQVLQQMWKQLGMNVRIEQLEQRQLVTRALEHNFDAMLFRWSGRPDPDLNTHQFFHSESARNYTHYSNPRIDELLDRARATQQRGERAELYREIGQILANEGPYHFLWSQNYYFIAKPTIRNFPAIPGGIPKFTEVWLAQ